jgi:hypothetical protein
VIACWYSEPTHFSIDEAGPMALPAVFPEKIRSSVAFRAATWISRLAIFSRKSRSSISRPPSSASFHRGDALDLLEHVHQARGIGVAALELEQVLGVGPALVLLADAVGDRHADIVEEDLVDLLLARSGAVQGDQRLDLDARRVHPQQQERDALLRLALAGGADQAEHPLGPLGVGRPDLRAVQDIVVAVFVFGSAFICRDARSDPEPGSE